MWPSQCHRAARLDASALGPHVGLDDLSEELLEARSPRLCKGSGPNSPSPRPRPWPEDFKCVKGGTEEGRGTELFCSSSAAQRGLAMVFRPLAVPATASRGFRTEKTLPTAAYARDRREPVVSPLVTGSCAFSISTSACSRSLSPVKPTEATPPVSLRFAGPSRLLLLQTQGQSLVPQSISRSLLLLSLPSPIWAPAGRLARHRKPPSCDAAIASGSNPTLSSRPQHRSEIALP